MKLLLLLEVLIAVFTADCHILADGPTNQVPTNVAKQVVKQYKEEKVFNIEAQLFPDGIENSDIEPEDPDFTEEPQEHYTMEPTPPAIADWIQQNDIVLRVNSQRASRRNQSNRYTKGKAGRKNIKKLMKKLEVMEKKLTQANLKINMELQSLRDTQNNISDTDTKLKVLLLSKMENITDGDLQLKMKLKSIKDFQKNITHADKELKYELNSALKHIYNGDLQLKKELQSIMDHQINITDTDKNFKIELQSAMKNITDCNMGLKMEISALKNIVNSKNSIIVSKLNSIVSKLNSTKQATTMPATTTTTTAVTTTKATTTKATTETTGPLKHFPYASNKKTWADAKAYCESIGGQIWTPVDRAETAAAYKACGTLCWNGWHKNSKDQWVTGTGLLNFSNFWHGSEPGTSDDAAWSFSGGLWGRRKESLYGWTCQM